MTILARRPGSSDKLRRARVDWAWCYAFLSLFLILFVAFTLWPIGATLYWSFTDYTEPGGMRFTGLENFQELLRDELYWKSFANTVLFSLGSTAIKLPLGLIMAVVLTRTWLAGRDFFRTVYFLPIVVPTAIAGLIFALLLNPLNGAIPKILVDIGLVQANQNIFLASREAALLTLIGVSVWQVMGQYMIYWMAALQSVPDSIGEAAQIDGANFWQELWYITLPSIRPFAIIITFLGLVSAFGVFGLVLTLSRGGPGTESYTMQYWVYDRAFTESPFRYGYISAGGLLFALFVVALFALQPLLTKRDRASRGETA
jgi:ABC-type sugar transport system permease subunit